MARRTTRTSKQSATKAKPAATRIVRLFKNGRNQAVRIPKEWELPGNSARVTKDGNRLILEPAARKTFGDVIAELRRRGPLPPEDRFPSDIDGNLPPVEPVDL